MNITRIKKKLRRRTNRIIRNIVTKNDHLHFVASKISFQLSVCFQKKINKIPFFIFKQIGPENCTIDLGSNIGNVIADLTNIENTTIYCFEPNPDAANVHEKRFLNSKANVKLIQKAAGLTNSSIKMYFPTEYSKNPIDFSVSSTTVENKSNIAYNDNYILVECVNFPEFLISLTIPVILLKIDIEGAEVGLLNKLIDFKLTNKVKYIFVETHQKQMDDEYRMNLNILLERIKNEKLNNIYTNWI